MHWLRAWQETEGTFKLGNLRRVEQRLFAQVWAEFRKIDREGAIPGSRKWRHCSCLGAAGARRRVKLQNLERGLYEDKDAHPLTRQELWLLGEAQPAHSYTARRSLGEFMAARPHCLPSSDLLPVPLLFLDKSNQGPEHMAAH